MYICNVIFGFISDFRGPGGTGPCSKKKSQYNIKVYIGGEYFSIVCLLRPYLRANYTEYVSIIDT